MLLDEPTAGVDPAAEDAIMAVISRLHPDGLTVVLVSHQLRRAGDHRHRHLGRGRTGREGTRRGGVGCGTARRLPAADCA